MTDYLCPVHVLFTVGVMGGVWMTSDLSTVKWMCLSLYMGQQFSRGEKHRWEGENNGRREKGG